jgi:4-alpha-glucanotransferase
MNLPGRADGNWRWRFAVADLTPELRKRLHALAAVSGRLPARVEDADLLI